MGLPHIEPNMFLMACAVNLELFGLQYLILKSSRELILEELNNSEHTKLTWENKAYVTATQWNFASNIGFGITALITSNIFGMLCDKLDIKKVILTAQISHYVPVLILTVAYVVETPQYTLYLAVLFMTTFGLLGGLNVVSIICSTYIARMFNKSRHTAKFGFLEAANTFGTMIPNVIGGFILDNLPFLCVPVTVLVLMVFSCLYSLIFLKPTTTHSNHFKRSTSVRKLIIETLTILVRKRQGLRRMTLLICTLSVLLASIAVLGANALYYLYLRKSPLNFTNGQVGIFCGFSQLCNGICLVYLLPLLAKQMHDMYLCVITLMARFIMYFPLAFANSKYIVFATLPFALLCNMEIPILRSYASAQVNDDEKGRLMGLFATFQHIGFTVCQFCVLQLYVATLDSFPGAAYILCAAVCLLIIPFLVGIKFSCSSNQGKEVSVENNSPMLPSTNCEMDNWKDVVDTSLT